MRVPATTTSPAGMAASEAEGEPERLRPSSRLAMPPRERMDWRASDSEPRLPAPAPESRGVSSPCSEICSGRRESLS
jgi:hypothetical protein